MSDNELYTTKLMKEKSQLQERVTSLEEQSIKETSSIGLQFNYLIPSMGKLCTHVCTCTHVNDCVCTILVLDMMCLYCFRFTRL